MARDWLKALGFVVAALIALAAAGPLFGLAAALTGATRPPMWLFAALYSLLLLAVARVAYRLDRTAPRGLGLVDRQVRLREFLLGFAISALAFVMLALVRGMSVGAEWIFAGSTALRTASIGLGLGFLLMFSEELLFRGYAFQRLVAAIGARAAIAISAVLFGVYHVAGSGMWGIGAFFTFAMPVLGGVLFGWAAVRSNGLALPLGLHLGGNWVQASVFSFRPDGVPAAAVWTARVSEAEAQVLFAPELLTHLPYICTALLLMAAVRGLQRPEMSGRSA
jgi:membrane protease YdiL (CAAX protease family)